MGDQEWGDLVGTGWLADHAADPDLRILDASYKMPGVTPTAKAGYESGHIPGAIFFDIDDIADHHATLPHMLPHQAEFAAKLGQLGIGDRHRVVIYDATGFVGATRAWWSFRVFGHEQISVLDGGLKKWIAESRSIETEIKSFPPAEFTARFEPGLIRSSQQILANLSTHEEQILDVRQAARFEGTMPEPWPGRRLGHIPGSRNLDYRLVLDEAGSSFRDRDAITRALADAGIDLSKPVVTSCGSGITAAIVAFALHLSGHRETAVYDGSWAEWGLPGTLPIETGPSAII